MQRTPWIDRRFTFDAPEGWMPNVLERLRGTHPRLVAMTLGTLTGHLTRRPAPGKWSAQEHLGHLADLEEIHEGRIDDLLARLPMLRGADMQNRKTEAADHNASDLPVLLEKFRTERERFVRRLAGLDDDTCRFAALHPRLQVPMRPVDLAFFTAEHDDHHLASIREILQNFHT